MPSPMRRLPAGLIVAGLTAALAGCSTTVAGSVAMTTVPVPAGAVDLALLNPGNYPTKPRAPLGAAGDTRAGAGLEGARLGNNVLGPWQADPTLVDSANAGEWPGIFELTFGGPTIDAAQAHHLLAVFTTGRSSAADQKSLVNAVLRFASPANAAAAVTDMTAASASEGALGTAITSEPLPIPRYPATSGLAHFSDPIGRWYVAAFTAHETYVLAQFASSKDSAEAAADLIAATLDKQRPLIDQFKPTPADQLKDLPIDPDGLLARTLPPDKENGAIYQRQAQLHFDNDPVDSQTLFNDAHLQQVARGRTTVYQTPDAASAQKIVDGFSASMSESDFGFGKFVPAAEIKGLPSAKCLTNTGSTGIDPTYYCLAVADRYAIELMAAQERDAHQQVSAQYLMLTGK